MCFSFLMISFLILNSLTGSSANPPSLKLLHILFRHGHRTTEGLLKRFYPKDPYINERYYPYGYGQLTNEGKRKAYALGQWLRKRYNKFLGTVYNPNILEAVSSGSNRTSATLSLVLAGLYPPKGTSLEWNKNLNWQPILYEQLPQKNYLSFPILYCSKYITLFENYLNSSEIRRKTFFYQSLLNYLREHTGAKAMSLPQIFYLYDMLKTEQEWGLKLPAWSDPIYPNLMHAAALDVFDAFIGTKELKTLGSGALLQKIINDTENKITNVTQPFERKVYIYSGHDYNISFLRNLLGILPVMYHNYGACLIIEVHQIKNVYGVKIYYIDKLEDSPQLLKMSGCDYFCSFKKFYKLVREYLPTKEMNCNFQE